MADRLIMSYYLRKDNNSESSTYNRWYAFVDRAGLISTRGLAGSGKPRDCRSGRQRQGRRTGRIQRLHRQPEGRCSRPQQVQHSRARQGRPLPLPSRQLRPGQPHLQDVRQARVARQRLLRPREGQQGAQVPPGGLHAAAVKRRALDGLFLFK